jgi:large subunit ribosomal protein L37Ae
MGGKKKKIGSSASFGARYGVRVRELLRTIRQKTSSKYICPSCNYLAVKRVSTGIWKCTHCGVKFAGAAYTPTGAARPEELPEKENV